MYDPPRCWKLENSWLYFDWMLLFCIVSLYMINPTKKLWKKFVPDLFTGIAKGFLTNFTNFATVNAIFSSIQHFTKGLVISDNLTTHRWPCKMRSAMRDTYHSRTGNRIWRLAPSPSHSTLCSELIPCILILLIFLFASLLFMFLFEVWGFYLNLCIVGIPRIFLWKVC